MAVIDELPLSGDFIAAGGKPQSGFDAPTDASDVFPTHIDMLGQGGYQAHKTTASVYAIPVQRRQRGMECFVRGSGDTNAGKKLRLCHVDIGGVDNDLLNNNNWIAYDIAENIVKLNVTITSNGQTVFNLPSGITVGRITVNGETYVEGNGYTIVGTVLTWDDGLFSLETTDSLVVFYT